MIWTRSEISGFLYLSRVTCLLCWFCANLTQTKGSSNSTHSISIVWTRVALNVKFICLWVNRPDQLVVYGVGLGFDRSAIEVGMHAVFEMVFGCLSTDVILLRKLIPYRWFTISFQDDLRMLHVYNCILFINLNNFLVREWILLMNKFHLSFSTSWSIFTLVAIVNV